MEHIPSRHRSEKKHPHNIDITGIAVALAFLVGIGLFAGDQNDHSVSEDRQSPSASRQTAPTVTMDKTETLQHPMTIPNSPIHPASSRYSAESPSARHSVTP